MSQDISQQKHWLSAWKIFYEPEIELEKDDPNAVCVSSVDSAGMPNSRIVLLKEVTEAGFLFYTNLKSQKGIELFANSKGALTWFSRKQNKQVRVQGSVSQVADSEADVYWASRDIDAKISASISKQSEIVSSRSQLEKEWNEFKIKFEGKEITRPSHWSGICIKPERVEFWEAVPGKYTARLHNRILFKLDGNQWQVERLYP